MRVSLGATLGVYRACAPKADGAFVDCEHCREVWLRHAGKNPRRAQLPTSDKIDTRIGHGRVVNFHVRR